MLIERTSKEIFDLIDSCSERVESGETDGFRTFEEGIKEALLWIIDVNNKNPLLDDY